MEIKDSNSLKSGHQNESEDEPRVFAIKREGSLWRMSKRSFLQAVGTGFLAGAAACSKPDKEDDDDDAIPPFESGGIAFRIVNLRDYNGSLPSSGTNVAIIGYVKNDFYFRYFDETGKIAFNQHESKIPDKGKLSELKELTTEVVSRGSAEPAEQARLAEIFTEVKSSASATGGTGEASGKRIQSSKGSTQRSGRRMQGSVASSPSSGKRIQGAEGRVDAGSEQRNLGQLTVNNQKYEESRIVETYTDGYSKLSHSEGTVVVRTDALPEIVRMQMPPAVPNPAPRPAVTPSRTTGTETAPSNSNRSRGSTTRSYGSHYWRPN